VSTLTLDGRRPTERRPVRFVIFALVVLVGIGALTARLFYLQVINGGRYTTLAQVNRTILNPIASARGLIYDRDKVALVANIPIYSVKVIPADLPLSQRPAVVATLAGLLSLDPSDINTAIDSGTGSRFDPVRIASDVPKATANFISESRLDLPGVVVEVEARRQYTDGAVLSQILGYTGAVSATQYLNLKAQGYLADDLIGKTGIEAVYESQLRGAYGAEVVERNAAGQQIQVLETVKEAQAGSSLTLTISKREQQLATEALKWGIQEAGLRRGVVIVMNPQTGEILAMVSLPTYDNNAFARGISNADFQVLLNDPDKPLLNHATNAHYPPGSTYKLVAGMGALADGKITPTSTLLTQPYLTLGDTRFYDWNRRGFGSCDIYCGFGHSSDTFFFQVAGMLGIDRLGYWARQLGFGEPTGVDLTGEVAGIVPTNQWKLDTLGQPIFPGETYQAGIGQGYDVVTPIQLINAYAALANGGTLYRPQVVREIVAPDGTVVRPFQPEAIRKLEVSDKVLRTMREAARNVVLIRHTYNLVDLPIVVAGKSGTAEFGTRDAQGRLPFHSWFVAFVPKDPAVSSKDPTGMRAVDRTDADLAVLAFAYDSGTTGNVATEIVKYYLQMHYGIQQDYRNFNLLERGNFYQSN
jgi:penicillin-binding protein 2